MAESGWQNIFLGIYQNEQAKKLKEQAGERPTYEIPDAIKSMMSTSELLAAEGMPAEQKQKMVQDYERNMSGALQGIASRKGGLTGVAALGQQANDAATNLGVMDVQARQANQRQLMANQQIMGNYQDQEFMMNKMMPYQELMDRYWKMKNAAGENITSGVGAEMSDIKGFIEGMFGGGGNSQPNPSVSTTGGGTQVGAGVSGGSGQSGLSGMMGGGFGGFSDIRLKTDIEQIGVSPSGIPTYLFKYRGEECLYQGVMAQELKAIKPEAVVEINGYLAVDYSQIDVEFKKAA